MNDEQVKEFAKSINKIVREQVALHLAPLFKQLLDLQGELARLSKEPRVIFSPTLQVPAQPVQVVKVDIPAPVVHPTPVQVNVENKVEAPVVHPTPVDVHVAAPQVTVHPELNLEKAAPPVVQVVMPEKLMVCTPERQTKTTITRDERTGRATGSVSTERDV